MEVAIDTLPIKLAPQFIARTAAVTSPTISIASSIAASLKGAPSRGADRRRTAAANSRSPIFPCSTTQPRDQVAALQPWSDR